MKRVLHSEREGLAQENLSVRAARAEVAVSRRHRLTTAIISARAWALYNYAVRLLVAYAQLTQDAQAFNVEIVNVTAEAAQEEALLLVHEQTLHVVEGDVLVLEGVDAEATVAREHVRVENVDVAVGVRVQSSYVAVLTWFHAKRSVLGKGCAKVRGHTTLYILRFE